MKIARDLFHRPRGQGIQRNHQERKRKKLETSVAPAMPCKTCMKNKHGESGSIQTFEFETKLACILES